MFKNTKIFYSMLFALASILKISPKRFATAVAKDHKEYAEKFRDQLIKEVSKIKTQFSVGIKRK